LELANELIVLISSYHMLFFTGIHPFLDPGASEDEPQGHLIMFGNPTDEAEEILKPGFPHSQDVGWSLITFSSITITVNIAYILWNQYLIIFKIIIYFKL
jgi:hypothetical protein